MNERIRELIAQAKVQEPFECSYTKEQWLTTFAELIVWECAAYAFSDDQDHKAMLKHFGVKERMTYFVIVEQDGETARLECESMEEAQMVRRSFVNYGKCSDVRIEVKE